MTDSGVVHRGRAWRTGRRFEQVGAALALAITAACSASGGGRNGGLVALDAQTGQRLWHASVPMANVSRPLTRGRLVVVAGASDCRSGKVTVAAVDGRTGRVVWHRSVVVSDPCTFGSLIAPAGELVVVGGTADVEVGASETAPPVALDVATGVQRWRAPATSVAVLATTSQYVITGDTGGNLVALDATSGRPRWTAIPDGQVVGAWADGKGLFEWVSRTSIAGSRQRLSSIDPSTGHTGWTVELPASEQMIAPSLADAIVVVNLARPETADLIGLDPATGHRLWRYTGDLPASASVAAAGKTLVVGYDYEDRSAVEVRDERAGVRRWILPKMVGPIGVATDGTTVTALSSHRTVGLSAADGHELWSRKGAFGFPAFASGLVFLPVNGHVKNPPGDE